MQHIFQILAD